MFGFLVVYDHLVGVCVCIFRVRFNPPKRKTGIMLCVIISILVVEEFRRIAHDDDHGVHATTTASMSSWCFDKGMNSNPQMVTRISIVCLSTTILYHIIFFLDT